MNGYKLPFESKDSLSFSVDSFFCITDPFDPRDGIGLPSGLGNFRGAFVTHNQAYIDFVLDMVESAREHDFVMSQHSSTAEQARYMGLHINQADAVFAAFPSPEGPEGWGLYVIRGADVLAGMGVDIRDVECPGRKPAMRHRRLGRPIDLTAFLVPTFMDARFVDICWGDSRDAVRHRRAQKRDGGEQAISNMRESITPGARAWLATHHPHLCAQH